MSSRHSLTGRLIAAYPDPDMRPIVQFRFMRLAHRLDDIGDSPVNAIISIYELFTSD
jgi:hypothetical protein